MNKFENDFEIKWHLVYKDDINKIKLPNEVI